MKRKGFIFMLVFIFAMTPLLGANQMVGAQNAGEASPKETDIPQLSLDKNVISAADIKALVEQLEAEGAIESGQTARALKVHLMAVDHFEKREATEKVVKHMNGFRQLLNHQQESELISEQVYRTLKANTDALIEKWASLTIVRDGQAHAVILIEEDAGETINKAADTLVEYIRKSTGAELPMMTSVELAEEADNFEDHIRIYIGSASEDGRDIEDSLENLDDQGFLIHPRENRVTVIGPTEWGTLNGVYDFLERYIGVRWLMPGPAGEDIPQLTDVRVPKEEVREEPAAAFRTLSPLSGSPDISGVRQPLNEWAQRNKLQGSYNWTVSFHHNLHTLFPPEKYAETHPEFYPNNNPPAPGDATSWQPCLTVEGSVDAAVAGIIEYFNEHPEKTSFSLGINDTRNFCEADPSHPDYPDKINSVGDLDLSDIFYTWVNDVVEQVLDVYPDKWFGLLAYNNVMEPPSFPLHPRVVPFITKDRMTWIDDDIRAEGHQQMDAWNEVASQVAWYDYIYGAFYVLPRVYPHQMAKNYQYAQEQGVFGHYAEIYHNAGDGPKAWISSKLQWDPHQDVDALLQEWYERTVGPEAAPDLAAYYDHWENFWTVRIKDSSWFHNGKSRTYLPFTSASYLDLVTDEDIEASRQMMEAVVAKSETPEQQKRAEILMRAFEYYEASALSYPKSGGIEPPANEQEAVGMLDEIEQSLEMAQKRHDLIEEFGSEPALTFPIDPRVDWSGVQHYQFQALQRYVEDEPEGGPVGALVEQFLQELPEDLRRQFTQEIPDPSNLSAEAVRTTASKEEILQTLDFSQGPWKDAEPFDEYLVMNTTNLPQASTKTYLLWDEENLYVGYENFDSNMSEMVVSDDAPGGWWSDGGNDSVETYVTKDPDSAFRGFFTNPKAVKFVYEKQPNSGPRPITGPEWQANTQIGDDYWNVIQVIPFAAIDVNPLVDNLLMGLFFRDYHGHLEYIGWGGGAPWVPEDFKPVHLVEE